MDNNKKIFFIEHMRILGFISVILIHITAEYVFLFKKGSIQSYFVFFINNAAKFAVPLFVFISGFVLSYSYSGRSVKPWIFYKKRIFKILIPYMLWSLLYSFIVFGKNVPSQYEIIFKNILTGNSFYHLYFILLILQFYLFFPLINYFSINKNLFLSFFSAAVITNIFFMNLFYFSFSDRFILNYIAFFAAGQFFCHYRENIREFISNHFITISVISSFILCLYIYQAYNFAFGNKSFFTGLINYSWYIYSMTSVIFIYSFFLRFFSSVRMTSLLKMFSVNAFFIYLAHPLVIHLVRLLMKKLNIVSYSARFLFELSAVIIILFFITAFKDRLVDKNKY